MTSRFAILLLPCVSYCLLAACSDEPKADAPGPPTNDGGALVTDAPAPSDVTTTKETSDSHDANAANDANDASSVCHAHPNDGEAIIATVVAEPMPIATGGTIAAGTYRLTSVTYYAGPDAATPTLTETWKQSLVIASQNFAIASVRGSNAEERSTGTFATADTTVTFSESCPKAKTSQGLGFTATAAELRVLVPSEDCVLVYRRQ